VADAVRDAKDEAPRPIAVEVGRLWADLDAKRAISLYRASVKIAYREPLVAPARPRPARKSAGKRASAR
jgi:hypothetical protein